MGNDMTDHDLAGALAKLTSTVTDLRIDVVKSVTTLSGDVSHLNDSHRELATQVKEIAINQAGCPARSGQDGVNARLKKLEQRTSDDKIEVRAELSKLREDQTGQIDPQREASVATGGRIPSWVVPILTKIFPWILLVGALMGSKISTDGDIEQVIRAFERVNARIESVEQASPADARAWQLDGHVESRKTETPSESILARPATSPDVDLP